MTTKNIDARREAFELAFPDDSFVWNNDRSEYRPSSKAKFGDGTLGRCLLRDRELEIWNAALDSLRVELPPEWPPISEKDEGANEMRLEIELRLEAAGVPYK